MRCPVCSVDDDKVVDSRASDEGAAIRRRRECLACGRRFTTFERVEEVALLVRKRSGVTVAFDRQKIVTGLQAAAKNRPLTTEQLETLASDVEEHVRLEGGETTTERIGRAVLDGLRGLDDVAYMRFASVYKGFDDADDFARELSALIKESPPKDSGPT